MYETTTIDILIAYQHGAKNVVTLFHKPSNEASTRVLTLLKQANAQAVAHATEDQASSHQAQNKAERTEFELDVTEEPPTGDQLKSIMEYLGGSPGHVIQGATDESDALRRLKADANTFQRPLVCLQHACIDQLLIVVGGGLESRQGR